MTSQLIDGDIACVVKFISNVDSSSREVAALRKLGSHTHVVFLIQSGSFSASFVDHQYIALEKCHELNLKQYLTGYWVRLHVRLIQM